MPAPFTLGEKELDAAVRTFFLVRHTTVIADYRQVIRT
jgi:hypothetical protein